MKTQVNIQADRILLSTPAHLTPAHSTPPQLTRARLKSVPAIALLLPALLVGCMSMSGLHTTAEPMEPNQLQAGRTLGSATSADWPHADWWKVYGDAQLDALIEEGLANSPTLRIAQDHVRKALAVAQAAGAVRTP
ncbi:MAG: hypothetical protein LBG66_05505, partial [Gallionellaceae bacterium]|nr:hypothetical protein [Gallionellaceae bacterium]